MMKRVWKTVILCGIFQATGFAVPEYMNYQARIFDATGAPMQGTYSVSFAIFDATREGNMVWGPFSCDGLSGEGHADAAVVWDGWFNVILGPKDQAGRSILSAFSAQEGEPRFIEIGVQGEIISPRQQFLAAPYSVEGYHAAQATNATYALHGVPPGCVLAFYGAAAPEGWLLCDGNAIPSDSKYDVLRSIVGSHTPDMRGRFVLGLDGDANTVRQAAADIMGATSGEDYHTLTIQEMPSHRHTWNYGWERDDSGTGGSSNEFTHTAGPWPNPQGYVYPIANEGGSQPHNNVPPYVTLNWIIKY